MQFVVPSVWPTRLPQFDSRRHQSLAEIHRGLLDAMRYSRNTNFGNIEDELRAAYEITPVEVRVAQRMERKQLEQSEKIAEDFYAKYGLNIGAEEWEVEKRQSWVAAHQVQMPPRQRLPVPALGSFQELRQALEPVRPRQPTPLSDSEPEYQVPSTSAASDPANRKRRPVAPPAIPAHRPRPMTPAGNPIPAPAVPIAVEAAPIAVEAEAAPVVPIVAEQQPEIAAPNPPRRRRRQPVQIQRDTADIQGRDLPDAPPTVVKQHHVLVGQKLAKTDQEHVIRRQDFTAVRYGNGLVVAQGNLGGLELGNHERNWQLIYNNPADPIVKMAAGYQHLLMLSEAGHLFTLGSNSDGQLGTSHRQGRQRQCQTTLASMRRTVVLKKRMPNGKFKKERAIFKKISAAGNKSSARTVGGLVYRCGEGLGPVFA